MMSLKKIKKLLNNIIIILFFILFYINNVIAATNPTGAWTITGTSASNTTTASASNTTAGVTTSITFGNFSNATTAVTTLANQNLANLAIFNPAAVQNTASLQFQYMWDTTPEGGTTLASTDAGTGEITIAYSTPVVNPIIHFDRMGGSGGTTQNGMTFTLLTGGLTLTRLSGTNHFSVTGTTVTNSQIGVANSAPTGFSAETSTNITAGTAGGSVRINGTVSSVTFRMSANAASGNVEGAGGDAIELKFSIDPPPIAQNDSYSINEDNTLTGNLYSNNGFGVDSDFNNDALTINRINGLAFTVGTPIALTNGSLTITNATTGAFTFVPNSNFNGTQTFTYNITDANGGTSTANATITINAVNDAPVDGNETASTNEDNTLTVPVGTGLLSNATDIDGGLLNITQFVVNSVTTSVSSTVPGVYNIPSVGQITIQSNGAYTFIPNTNYTGSVPIITYTVSDSNGGFDSSTLNITVTPLNDPPVVIPDSIYIDPNNTYNSTPLTNVLANDSDIEGQPLTIISYSVDTNNDSTLESFSPGATANILGVGSITLNTNGGYSFSPNTNYSGPVPVINYIASDGVTNSSTTLNITVSSRPILTKSLSSYNILPGQNTTLTFIINNNGPYSSDKTNLSFTDNLPSNWQISSPNALNVSSSCQGSYSISANSSSQTFSINGLNILQNQICTISINVTNMTGQFNNSCETNPIIWTNTLSNISPLDNRIENNITPQCLIVTTPVDLSINKVATPSILVGQNATFTLTISNLTPSSTASGVSINDIIPSNFMALSYTCNTSGSSDCDNSQPAQNISGTLSNNNFSLNNLTVVNGNSLTINILARAISQSTGVNNTATVSTPLSMMDTNLSNNSSTSSTVIQYIDLTIKKDHTPDPVTVGQTVLIYLGVQNIGNGTTTDAITITDTFPSGLIPQTIVSAPYWACNIISQTVTCTTLQILAQGEYTSDIQINAVAQGNFSSVTNTATVSTLNEDINSTNNTATDVVNIVFAQIDSFTPDNRRQVTPGSFADHPHTFISGSNGTLNITANPAISLLGWSYAIYIDSDCSGTLESGEYNLFTSIAVTQNQTLCQVVRVFTPAGASNGQSYTLNVSANFTPTIGSIRNYTRVDLTTIASSTQIYLEKDVRNITTGSEYSKTNNASPGHTIEYRITFRNNSYTNITNLTINDATQSYTTFVSTNHTSPTNLGSPTITSPLVNSTGAIIYNYPGFLAPGEVGYIYIRLLIDN